VPLVRTLGSHAPRVGITGARGFVYSVARSPSRGHTFHRPSFRGSAATLCELVCAASGPGFDPPDEDEILAEAGLDPRQF
jgi:hypothetical protein